MKNKAHTQGRQRLLPIFIALVMVLQVMTGSSGYAASAWTAVGTPGFSAGSADYTSMAMDNSNNPYVIFRDGTNSYKATVMKYNGTSWEAVGAAGFSAGLALYTSIAIDSDGNPYVAYQDGVNSNKATVMKYNGTSWEAVGTAGFSAGGAYDTSIEIDSNDTLYVAYRDGNDSYKATVMKYDGTNWAPVGTAGFSAGGVSYPSIAIDNNDTLYVTYQDGVNSNKATVMKYNGTGWETVGAAGFSAGGVYYISIAIDSNGTPYVAYRDGGNGNKATVMKYNTTSWEVVGAAGFSAGGASCVSFAIDKNNHTYVAYADESNSYKAYVMKYLAPDTLAPILTGGTVIRTSDTAGTMTFTSDEAGHYYYAIVEDGAALPVIDTTGEGIACTTSETTITDPAGLTAGAKDLYIKVKDAAGNVSNELKVDIAAYVVPDTIAPILTEGTVTRTSDTAGTMTFTSDEAGHYYYAIVEDGAALPVIDTTGEGIACTTSETTITDPAGLTAGAKDLYIKVKDAAGNVSNELKVDIAAYVAPSNGGNDHSTHPATPNQEVIIVIVNGVPENMGTETKMIVEGQSVVTVEVNNDVIERIMEEAIKNNTPDANNRIQITVADTESTIAKVALTGDIIKKLEENTFDLSIKRGDVEYLIPAEEFTISNMAKDLGIAEELLKDITIEIQITNLDEFVVAKYNEVAQANGAELISPPVGFEIIAKTTKTDGSTAEVAISNFNNYVERIMGIPAGVDPSKITTGIVFNPNGTYSHVPTEVFEQDGKWFARLNSLTNSDYSVVWNSVTITSVQNHWSKDAVNDMASRLVIFSPESFEPDRAITRADFAEYIVRALGFYREGATLENKYKDVMNTHERTLGILIANEYGIITGYPDGTFKPDELITREEAMAMYSRAMKISKLTGADQERYSNYEDYSQTGAWAKEYVKNVLAAHVFNGSTATTISPKSNLTYAEAAQAMKNLLVESKLINE